MMAGVGDRASGAPQARRAARPRPAPGRRRRARTIPTRPSTSSTAAASAWSSRAATCRSWASAPTTFVDGAGRVAGFGHPMLDGGDEALPSCIGRVLWINASAQASHKVGECARPLGTLVQDRQTAIILDEHVVAPVIPVDVEITGVDRRAAVRTGTRRSRTTSSSRPASPRSVLASVIEATTSRAARRHVDAHDEGRHRRPRHGRPRGRRRRRAAARPTPRTGSARSS